MQVKLSDELCDVEMILGQFYIAIGSFDVRTKTYIACNFYEDN